MAVTSYNQAMAVTSAQHHQQRRGLPLHTTTPARFFTNRPPATLSLQVPQQRFFVVRADSQRRGDNESKEVLEAFFLGKAFAEAVTERLGTVVGELLSDVGRWQAEQQKQVRDFQEEVQERAKKARAKALQEARSIESKDSKSVSQNGAYSPSTESQTQAVVPITGPNAIRGPTDL